MRYHVKKVMEGFGWLRKEKNVNREVINSYEEVSPSAAIMVWSL
jgi:hypothetical protein